MVELVVSDHLRVVCLAWDHWVAAESAERVLVENVLNGVLRCAILTLVCLDLAARFLADEALVEQKTIGLNLRQFLSLAL